MPINSNELRLGNIVLDPYGNEREVTGVHGKFVYLENGVKFSCYEASELSPVALTPEVFLKCGFIEELEYFILGKVWISVHQELNLLCCPTETEIEVFVKSLHQLQNLYFALTGQELPVTDKNETL